MHDSQLPDTEAAEVIEPERIGGEWFTPSEAAVRLGISERTLWRRVNKGRLHRRIVRGAAEVFIPSGSRTALTQSGIPKDDLPDMGAMLEVVERSERAMMKAVVEEIKRSWERDVARLAELTDTSIAQARTLGELSVKLEHTQSENARLTAELARAHEPRPGWWQRWLGSFG
jgi:hypothetical protein